MLAGLGADAKSGVSAAEAKTFAGQAVAALRAAIQAGWAERDELNEADFDPLRKRDDFQNLARVLEVKSAPHRATTDAPAGPAKK